MIAELLRERLAARLPHAELRTGPSEGSLVFPAVREEVGDVVVYDDGDEATVFVGTITHGHFDDYAEGVSEDERAVTVAESVADFLDALFADRVLLWRSGRSGGWRVLDDEEQPDVRSDAGTQFFLWSGPIG